MTVGCLVFPSGATAAAPTLSSRQAATSTHEAVRQEYRTSAKVTRCARSSASRRVCRARWNDGLRRFAGTVTIRRSGTTISPIDTYAIRATGRDRYLGTKRVRAAGRVIVDTRRAKYGQTLRLLGNERVDIDITAGRPIDPFPPPDEFQQPPAGSRFVAVPLTATNRANSRVEENADNSGKLILAGGRALSTTIVASAQCPTTLSMAPGERRVGCSVFSVPYGTTISQFEYSPSSGFGLETGVWR